MAVLKVKDPVSGAWMDISGTGAQGPPGGPVPVGGDPGQVIAKTGPADMEVGWQDSPRGFVAQAPLHPINMGMSVVVPTANTFTNLHAFDVTIDPTRMYQFWAGVRAVSDAGASCNMNITLVANGVGIFDDYLTTSGAEVSLWGAWSQQIVQPGSLYNSAAGPDVVDFVLKVKFSVANLTVYLPRITVLDVGAA